MAAKRGKKQARRSGGSAGTPGWVWLLVGLLIGGVVAVGVYLKMPRAGDNGLPRPNASARPTRSSSTGVAPEGSAPTAPDTTAAAPQKTKFDFYTLLPEKEVVIPDEELSARVKAVLRRFQAAPVESAPVAHGAFRIDEERAQIHFTGVRLILSGTEFRLLRALCAKPGRVFSRAQLMDIAWDDPGAALERTVDAHIKSVRAKLKEVRREADPIETHRGFGYSLREIL